MARLHDSETYPLHPDLSYAQQTRSTLEGANFFAARDIGSGLRECQNIAKLRVGTRYTKQHPVRRDALRGSAGDDAVMLEQVGKHDADNNDARVGFISCFASIT
jgi:hypothetical protein